MAVNPERSVIGFVIPTKAGIRTRGVAYSLHILKMETVQHIKRPISAGNHFDRMRGDDGHLSFTEVISGLLLAPKIRSYEIPIVSLSDFGD